MTAGSIGKVMGNGQPHIVMVRMQLAQSFWRGIWQHLKKLNVNFQFVPISPPLGIYTSQNKKIQSNYLQY